MPSGNVMSEASAMRQSLLLSAGEGVGVALTEGGEAQRIQCFVRQRRVRAADAEGALRLNAFGKELVVHILYDHIGAQHARLRLLGRPVPGVLPGQLLMQAAEGAGEGGLAGAVAAAEQDELSVRDGEDDVIQAAVRAVRVGEGHVPEVYHTDTAFHTSSAAGNAASRIITAQSAGRIRISTRQVRGLRLSMPRVTAAMLSSSAALLAAVSSGT